jgi:xanthine phosphoribosyltransferase
MNLLKERILKDGRNLGGGILKVDGFINHQIDPQIMEETGKILASRFISLKPTKILTAEVSGIAPAIATAITLHIPVIYARKVKPVTMPGQIYVRSCPSHTKGVSTDLMVSPEVLGPYENVLIIDDFLASGQTLFALAQIVLDSHSRIAGFGVIIEKSFEEGRKHLSQFNVPVEPVVIIKEMTGDSIVME